MNSLIKHLIPAAICYLVTFGYNWYGIHTHNMLWSYFAAFTLMAGVAFNIIGLFIWSSEPPESS